MKRMVSIFIIIFMIPTIIFGKPIKSDDKGYSFYNSDDHKSDAIKLTDAPFTTPPPEIIVNETEIYKDVHKYTNWWHATCQHVAHDEWVAWRIYKDGRPDEELGS